MACCQCSVIFSVIMTGTWIALFVGTVHSQMANGYDDVNKWHHDDAITADQQPDFYATNGGQVDEKRASFNDKLRGLRRLSRIIDELRFESAIRPAKKSPEVIDELDNENGNRGKPVSTGYAIPLSSDGPRNLAPPQGVDEEDMERTPTAEEEGWKLRRVPDTLSQVGSRVTAREGEDHQLDMPKRGGDADSLVLEPFRQRNRESRRRWGGKASRPQPFGIGLFGKRSAEASRTDQTGDLVDTINKMLIDVNQPARQM
ncbi:uncharacterized protein LOC121421594 [Lytechinus variegatus]|uniref:uncharacterized protein LOC121421594 n=1 Tax=Lytechinus variegatus TaxID=7654 RepID=UPI001BB0E99F|nr:uncharacterized protein LOC121421594 [Lytechinus variegatus]